MYIRFELTAYAMVIKLKDEAGTDIESFTFAITDYKCDPFDATNSCCRIVIRKIADPNNVWPPIADFPPCRLVFINTSGGPFQTVNEASSLP